MHTHRESCVKHTNEINTDGRVTHNPVKPFTDDSVVKIRHTAAVQTQCIASETDRQMDRQCYNLHIGRVTHNPLKPFTDE